MSHCAYTRCERPPPIVEIEHVRGPSIFHPAGSRPSFAGPRDHSLPFGRHSAQRARAPRNNAISNTERDLAERERRWVGVNDDLRQQRGELALTRARKERSRLNNGGGGGYGRAGRSAPIFAGKEVVDLRRKGTSGVRRLTASGEPRGPIADPDSPAGGRKGAQTFEPTFSTAPAQPLSGNTGAVVRATVRKTESPYGALHGAHIDAHTAHTAHSHSAHYPHEDHVIDVYADDEHIGRGASAFPPTYTSDVAAAAGAGSVIRGGPPAYGPGGPPPGVPVPAGGPRGGGAYRGGPPPPGVRLRSHYGPHGGLHVRAPDAAPVPAYPSVGNGGRPSYGYGPGPGGAGAGGRGGSYRPAASMSVAVPGGAGSFGGAAPSYSHGSHMGTYVHPIGGGGAGTYATNAGSAYASGLGGAGMGAQYGGPPGGESGAGGDEGRYPGGMGTVPQGEAERARVGSSGTAPGAMGGPMGGGAGGYPSYPPASGADAPDRARYPSYPPAGGAGPRQSSEGAHYPPAPIGGAAQGDCWGKAPQEGSVEGSDTIFVRHFNNDNADGRGEVPDDI